MTDENYEAFESAIADRFAEYYRKEFLTPTTEWLEGVEVSKHCFRELTREHRASAWVGRLIQRAAAKLFELGERVAFRAEYSIPNPDYDPDRCPIFNQQHVEIGQSYTPIHPPLQAVCDMCGGKEWRNGCCRFCSERYGWQNCGWPVIPA